METKKGMLQVQLLVPSISAESTVTASLKRNDILKLELENEIKVMDVSSEQKIKMKYGNPFYCHLFFLCVRKFDCN